MHKKFSIMHYGPESVMTDDNRDDLAALCSAVWNSDLADINGPPIRLFEPYSAHHITPAPELIAALCTNCGDRVETGP